eukprot:scaffold713_cov131-Cylindrotheca_fusiformis.AAC.9
MQCYNLSILGLLFLLPTCSFAETINVLVLLVQWANHANRELIPRDQIDQLWNGPSDDVIVPGQYISEYLETNSYGKYIIEAEVIDWFRVSQTEEYTSNGKMGNSADGKDIEDVLVPVLNAAVAGGVDMSKYDRQGDGNIRGYAAENGGTDCETGADYLNRIISKSWGVDEPIAGTPYTLSTFATASVYRRTCNLEINRIGVPTHEWFHSAFGIADLYDTGGRYNGSRVATGGIGAFGIMSYAGGQKHNEAYPGLMTPWHKMEIGALTPIEITVDGVYTARPSALQPDIYKISAPYETGEYLLIENRQPLLSDENLWQPGGIVIYHIDENMEGIGNFVRGGPFQDDWPGNGKHYKVAVLQADGAYELEMALNLGHIEDFWKEGDVLGPGNGESVATDAGTYPNTDSYVGGNIRVTDLVIDSFKDEGNGDWSFRVQNLEAAEPSSAPSLIPTAVPQPTPPPVSTGPTPEPVSCYPTSFTDPSFICNCQDDCINSADLICSCEDAVACCESVEDTPEPTPPPTNPPTPPPTPPPSAAPSTSQVPTVLGASPAPSALASSQPSMLPSTAPSKLPTTLPTKQPTSGPSAEPSMMPSELLTQSPTTNNADSCLVTVSTSQCDVLMQNFTWDDECDCYNFCNGNQIQCCPFGNDCSLECEGELVAGCAPPEPSSEPTPVPFVGNSCLLNINSQSCQAVFPSNLQPVQGCDCYNFCNGRYFSCCAEGQPCGMQCEGSVVAGCAFEPPDETEAPTAAAPVPTPAPGPSTYFFWPDGFI